MRSMRKHLPLSSYPSSHKRCPVLSHNIQVTLSRSGLTIEKTLPICTAALFSDKSSSLLYSNLINNHPLSSFKVKFNLERAETLSCVSPLVPFFKLDQISTPQVCMDTICKYLNWRYTNCNFLGHV